jgi:hypothetical protein
VKVFNHSDDAASPASLVLAGDLDGDGLPDLLAPDGAHGAGLVFSGRTGSLLLTLHSTRSMTAPAQRVLLGDVDGDGTVDFAVAGGSGGSEPWNSSGVEILSGKDGASIGVFDSEAEPVVLGEGRDYDGDGIPDLPVGFPQEGEVLVLSGKGLTAHPQGTVVERGDWPEILELKGNRYLPVLPSQPCPR